MRSGFQIVPTWLISIEGYEIPNANSLTVSESVQKSFEKQTLLLSLYLIISLILVKCWKLSSIRFFGHYKRTSLSAVGGESGCVKSCKVDLECFATTIGSDFCHLYKEGYETGSKHERGWSSYTCRGKSVAKRHGHAELSFCLQL